MPSLMQRRAEMFDAIVSFFRSLIAEPRQDELLIRVRVDRERDQLHRRR
jgi:hypothetical protein